MDRIAFRISEDRKLRYRAAAFADGKSLTELIITAVDPIVDRILRNSPMEAVVAAIKTAEETSDDSE